MTDKADFTEEEWTRLKRSPFVAGMAISLSDPGGPIELVKETAATLKTVTAGEDGSRGALVAALAKEAVADAKAHHNPLKDFKPKGALAGQEILDELIAATTGSSPARRPLRRRRPTAPGSTTPPRKRRTRPRRAVSSASTPSA